MFSSCKRLKNLAATFPKVTSAYSLCSYCDKLETISLSLPEVTNFSYAFEACPMLKDVYLDLDKLQSVSAPFGSVGNSTKNLESVTLNAPLLKSVSNMFEGKKKLTSFKGDLSSLTSGYAMFSGCNKLTSFDAELPSLSTADSMFSGCNLDAESCAKIFGSLPKYTSGSHKMDIRVQVSAVDTIEEVLGLRKGEIDKTATVWRPYIAKGWTFYISISND